jgi:hypothetical protein
VTLEIEQVRAAAECITDFRKRNRDVRERKLWRVQLWLNALGVVGFSDRNGLASSPHRTLSVVLACEDNGKHPEG